MSQPENILNYFRSYSYHHVLFACDGTETAEELAKETEITKFDHENAIRNGGKYQPQSNSKGRYVLLINGMSDAQLTIESVNWSSVIFPTSSSSGSAGYRTLAVDGEMVIQEPFGINFFNILNDSLKSLGVDANGLVFVLKTIFVGHRDSGNSEYITNIRPLMFIMCDINATLDITGAVYTLQFVGISNGAGQLPHVSSVGEGFSFKIPPGKNLGEVLETHLTNKLNGYYKEQKESFKTDCSSFSTEFENEFFDVEYKIVVDPEYKKGKYIPGTANLDQHTSKGEQDAILASGTSIDIEGLIDTIVMSSAEVVKEEKDKNGQRFTHRITSTINTKPNFYEVTYHVQRQQLAMVPPGQDFQTYNPIDPETGKVPGIIFDYIFTGKNVDILDFDLKMNMGLVFFQTLAVESSIPETAVGSKTKTKVSGLGGSNLGDGKGRKRPFFLGMSAKDSKLRNRRNPGPATNYASLFMRHAAYENIEAKVTIRGNPQLLEETTQLPSDLSVDPATKTTPTVHTTPESDADINNQASLVWPAIHKIPGFVKINVMMPNSFINDPSQYNDPVAQNDYAQPFWYQGWYNVLAINHQFSGGEFTQELELYSLPTDFGQHELGADDCKEAPTSPPNTTSTSNSNERGKNFVPRSSQLTNKPKYHVDNLKAQTEASNTSTVEAQTISSRMTRGK